MIKKLKCYIPLLFIGLIIACEGLSDFSETNPDNQIQIVVNGILIPGEKATIKLTKLSEFNDTLQNTISDAVVSINFDNRKYNLELINNNTGEYSSNDQGLEIIHGRNYILEIEHQGNTLYAETTIPYPPENIELEMEGSEFSDSTNFYFPGYIEVLWESQGNNYFYTVFDCDSINPFAENYCTHFFNDNYPYQSNFYILETDGLVHNNIYDLTIYGLTEEFAQYYYYNYYQTEGSFGYVGNIENGYGIFAGQSSVNITFQYFTDSITIISNP